MSYRAHKQVIDTHTHMDRYTDTGDGNTRRTKLASGKNWITPIKWRFDILFSCCLRSQMSGENYLGRTGRRPEDQTRHTLFDDGICDNNKLALADISTRSTTETL